MATVDYALNLSEIRDFLIDVAHKAGSMITGADRPKAGGTGTKLNSVDLVTETDKAVEDMVQSTLRERYPDIGFLGEESYIPPSSSNNTNTNSPSTPTPSIVPQTPTFIVDPIDGTTNFVHLYPYVSISLGLAVARDPVIGVVYNPYTGLLYSAVKGGGAWLKDEKSGTLSNTTQQTDNVSNKTENDKLGIQLPLPGTAAARAFHTRTEKAQQQTVVRNKSKNDEERMTLATSLVAIEWGSIRAGNDWSVKWRTFERLGRSADEPGASTSTSNTDSSSNPDYYPTTSSTGQGQGQGKGKGKGQGKGAMVHSLRSLGSAALNLCAVASGTLDAYWEAGPWPWDFCAGFVVLREAGGLVVDAQAPPESDSMADGTGGDVGGHNNESNNNNNDNDDDGDDDDAALKSFPHATLDGRRCLAVRAGRGQARYITRFWGCVEGRFEVGG